ncbi:hypothetical protein MJO55_25535 [Mycolicibacterium rufum]|uniref:Uncharacterized protein n=1 Tax=Mycolicibacterium rufum TaxID=318424 RepID=A0A9X2XYN7_9MYCO|nr:hypothetical protein [Mycolicibacterium rufum]MCV7071132.1 hypothetical protein [Mycolicibacterium rufum]ULP36507.1 hypothetical protein MJO55_25535 [Mycolicibacterium rufum]
MTLVLAVFAVFLGKDFLVQGPIAIFLGVAVLALLVSAICGVVIVSPWRYGYAEDASLRPLTDAEWGTSEVEARQITANANLDALKELREGTDTQVKWLTAAGVSQGTAVAALAIATVLALANPISEIEQARKAFENQEGMSKFLDALEGEGLTTSRDDVVKLASFFRLSCDSFDPTLTVSPDAMRDHLVKELNIEVSVDQLKALEPARVALCKNP